MNVGFGLFWFGLGVCVGCERVGILCRDGRGREEREREREKGKDMGMPIDDTVQYR